MTTEQLNRKDYLNNWNLHIASWLILLLIYGLLFLPFMPPGKYALRALGNILPMALLFYINFSLIDRFLARRKYAIYLIAITLLIVVFSYIRVLINHELPGIEYELLEDVKKEYLWIAAVGTNFGMVTLSSFIKLWYKEKQRQLFKNNNWRNFSFYVHKLILISYSIPLITFTPWQLSVLTKPLR